MTTLSGPQPRQPRTLTHDQRTLTHVGSRDSSIGSHDSRGRSGRAATPPAPRRARGSLYVQASLAKALDHVSLSQYHGLHQGAVGQARRRRGRASGMDDERLHPPRSASHPQRRDPVVAESVRCRAVLFLPDVLETFFDSRLDLFERQFKVHSDRLKNRAGEVLSKSSANLRSAPLPRVSLSQPGPSR